MEFGVEKPAPLGDTGRPDAPGSRLCGSCGLKGRKENSQLVPLTPNQG